MAHLAFDSGFLDQAIVGWHGTLGLGSTIFGFNERCWNGNGILASDWFHPFEKFTYPQKNLQVCQSKFLFHQPQNLPRKVHPMPSIWVLMTRRRKYHSLKLPWLMSPQAWVLAQLWEFLKLPQTNYTMQSLMLWNVACLRIDGLNFQCGWYFTKNRSLNLHEPLCTPGSGGARQYIHQMFPVAGARVKSLGELLNKVVPPAPDVSYHTSYPVPACLSGHLT